jgi:hypothetical protein
MRTISLYRDDSLDGRRLDEALERSDGDALIAASANPDHSETVRSAALRMLRSRGGGEFWRMAAPSYLAAKDIARGDTLFFGAGAFFRGFLILSAIACWAAAITALFVQRSLVAPAFGIGAAALIGWFLLSLLRFKPARVVVLRANDEKLYRRAFRCFLGTELAGFGHVWRWAGPESAEAPERVVGDARDYRMLAHAMRHLIGLNWESATGAVRRAQPVAAAPAWRPLTQDLMIASADAVVVDLTGAGDDAAWPLDAARAGSCVFVALWGQLEAAEATLRQAGVDADCYAYAPDGHAVQRAKFRAAMIAAMRAKLERAA